MQWTESEQGLQLGRGPGSIPGGRIYQNSSMRYFLNKKALGQNFINGLFLGVQLKNCEGLRA